MRMLCTLPPERLAERLAWIRDEILPHALRSERLADGFAWELEDTPGLAETLDRWIALERDCCGGAEFVRTPGSQPGWIRLEVRGVDVEAAPFRALAAHLDEGGGSRLAKAGVLGVAAACVACCALPLTASAILGGAAAAVFAWWRGWRSP